MITTNTFTNFARRLAATKGCPYVVIAETPNPIRQLEQAPLRQRAEAMLDTIIFGLTQSPAAIQRQHRESRHGTDSSPGGGARRHAGLVAHGRRQPREEDEDVAQTSVRLESESVAELMTQAYEHAYEQGWTDGLPIIPATPEAVQRFIAASGRPAEEVIGIIPPRQGRATVEVLAVNAVMAGCRPEYHAGDHRGAGGSDG